MRRLTGESARVEIFHPRNFRLNVVLYKKSSKVLFPKNWPYKKLNENLNPNLRFDLNFKNDLFHHLRKNHCFPESRIFSILNRVLFVTFCTNTNMCHTLTIKTERNEILTEK